MNHGPGVPGPKPATGEPRLLGGAGTMGDNVRLPASARLGPDGGGFGIMMNLVLPWFNVLNAAVSAGLMERAVESTARHVAAATFQPSGSRIADLPTVRAFVARMRIQTDQTKALNRDTVSAIAAGRADATLRVLESKAAAGEAAAAVTDLAMRVCGGAAVTRRWWRWCARWMPAAASA